jgi:sugar phosphate isomerase/epimerase
MSHPPIGMQLNVFSGKYPVPSEHAEAILDGVVSAGFSAVEGGPPSDPVLRQKMLKERGLRYAGGHTVCAALDDDTKVDALIRDLHTCEAADLCNSGLWNWLPQDLENFKFSIDLLNRVGRRFRKEGIHLHYHNHDFEFKAVKSTEAEPQIGMKILLDRLDPTACDLCIDAAWVYRGNLCPAAYLKAIGSHVGYLHLKDTDEKNWFELGKGKVPFDKIFALLPKLNNVRWLVYEQDTTEIDPVESAKISRAFIKEKLGY